MNRVFFPQGALDEWLSNGKVDLDGEELTIFGEARRYRIVEAARVVREVTGLPDVNELVGLVKTHVYLNALGAELLETSMVLGDNAYDVVPGFLGAPIGTFAEHMVSGARVEARKGLLDAAGVAPPHPASDEELLAQFLLKSL